MKRMTVREIRKWMFDNEYLTLTIGGEDFDNTEGRRYLYELPDQDVEVSIRMYGNIIVIE